MNGSGTVPYRQRKPEGSRAAAAIPNTAQDLNCVQGLLIGAYVRSGGDMASAGQFDAFMRCVDNHHKFTLAPGRRRVFELVWHAQDDDPWERIAADLGRRGIPMQPASVRRQAMRAAQDIAPIIRARGWERWIRTAVAPGPT